LQCDPWRIQGVCRRIFGGEVVWAPNSPSSRQAFGATARTLRLLREDWTNIIRVEDWGQPRQHPGRSEFTIGRHSRDSPDKWPTSRKTFLAAYPDDPSVPVRLMGFGPSALAVAGPPPPNWTCLRFNQIPVREFLQTIDFFVYFHDPAWRETFGRTIAEAIGSGAVAILPDYLRQVFGPAALYCREEEVLPLARRIWSEPGAYAAQSDRAWRWLRDTYGPGRILALVDRALQAGRDNAVASLVTEARQSRWLPGSVRLRSGYYLGKARDRLRLPRLGQPPEGATVGASDGAPIRPERAPEQGGAL
jgi:hypothetical protein